MRQALFVIGCCGLLALLVFGAASCQRAAAQGLPWEPPGDMATPTSWSDPRVIDELVKSCAFDPDKLTGEERQKWLGGPGMPSALTCRFGIDQSCVYDPCYDQETRECRPGCAKDCGGCGQQCAASCESCKTACRDGACRKGCAESCATCRQTCVRKRDRCSTGTCAAAYRQCRQKMKSDWVRKECGKVCQVYLSCQQSCIKKHGDSAYERCTKPCQPKDNHGCGFAFCGGQFGMGINPLEYP